MVTCVTCQLEVTLEERAIILLLRKTKYGSVTVTKQDGELKPIIHTEATVDLRTLTA